MNSRSISAALSFLCFSKTISAALLFKDFPLRSISSNNFEQEFLILFKLVLSYKSTRLSIRSSVIRFFDFDKCKISKTLSCNSIS